ncbi:hypothetical protein UFOVP1165_61 [uncultured Caudovirales phage]|uniref:Uncharacterized protein n=1 Tax=uncultured Caudovirales phage TaxID=2100421 RepID=A0A6J5R3K9_9CAUD|nr:hypothetical protein UFOVP1165_61 [uncultured Caudovirales phage]
MIIEGIAGRFAQRMAGIMGVSMTSNGSVRVAQVEGPDDEGTRAGLRFYLSAGGATGIAPVQALPSTAAQWMLWNPNGNTVTAFIDVLGVMLNSGTAGAGGTFYVCPVPPKFAPATVPSVSTANALITDANPISTRGSNLICVSSQTLLNAVASNWLLTGFMNPAGTILGQTQMENRDIRGKLAIPPGCGLAFAVVSPTGTTPLFSPYASWREYASDME